MTRIIPARIEDGRIVPDGPLPDPSEVRGVSIVIEVAVAGAAVLPGPSETTRAEKEAAMSRLVGTLKGFDDPGATYREEYARYLEEKYR